MKRSKKAEILRVIGGPSCATRQAFRETERTDLSNLQGRLAFGAEPVRELLSAGHQVDFLYVSQRAQERFRPEMRHVRDTGGTVLVVNDHTMQQLCGPQARHQGIAAVCRGLDYESLDSVLELGADPLLLVDGVTDPRNLGAIMRSAEGAGVRAIVLARDHTAELTATAIKASAGARAHLSVAHCGNVASTLEMLKRHGYWIVGLAPQAERSLYDGLDVDRRLALVVGGEHRGLRPVVARHCDFLVSIPMYGKVASLNVAVACAVALYEIARARAVLIRARGQDAIRPGEEPSTAQGQELKS